MPSIDQRQRFDRVGGVVVDDRRYLPVSMSYKAGDPLRERKHHSPAYFKVKAQRTAARAKARAAA